MCFRQNLHVTTMTLQFTLRCLLQCGLQGPIHQTNSQKHYIFQENTLHGYFIIIYESLKVGKKRHVHSFHSFPYLQMSLIPDFLKNSDTKCHLAQQRKSKRADNLKESALNFYLPMLTQFISFFAFIQVSFVELRTQLHYGNHARKMDDRKKCVDVVKQSLTTNKNAIKHRRNIFQHDL